MANWVPCSNKPNAAPAPRMAGIMMPRTGRRLAALSVEGGHQTGSAQDGHGEGAKCPTRHIHRHQLEHDAQSSSVHQSSSSSSSKHQVSLPAWFFIAVLLLHNPGVLLATECREFFKVDREQVGFLG